jgi:hypothetical protein
MRLLMLGLDAAGKTSKLALLFAYRAEASCRSYTLQTQIEPVRDHHTYG